MATNNSISKKTEFLDLPEISTPSNPSTDIGRLYVKDSSGTTKLYFRDNAGTETNLIAGSGDIVKEVTQLGVANNGTFTITAKTVCQVLKLTNATTSSLNVNYTTESDYTQEDSSKTLFGSGVVQLETSSSVGNGAWGSQLTPSGGPTDRVYAILANIGNYIFYWGGMNTATTLNRYDVTNNTWSTVTPSGTPPLSRFNAGSCVVGTNFYIFGGKDSIDTTTLYNAIWKYDSIANSWTNLSPSGTLPSATRNINLCELNGDLYFFGGGDSGGSQNFWKYNITNNLWTQITGATGTAPDARRDAHIHSYNNKIYILGGNRNSGSSTTVIDVHEYNPSANSWSGALSVTGTSPSPYWYFSTTQVINSNIYIWGGTDADSNNMYRYDISTSTWTTLSSATGTAPASDYGRGNFQIKDEYIYVFKTPASIYKYTALSLVYPTNTTYYVATASASSINMSSAASINAVNFTKTSNESTTTLRFIVSFDGRTTWKYWNGSAWTTTTLSSSNIATNGHNTTNMASYLVANWNNTLGTTLDFAVGLKTTDVAATPNLDNIEVVINLGGYDHQALPISGTTGYTLTAAAINGGSSTPSLGVNSTYTIKNTSGGSLDMKVQYITT